MNSPEARMEVEPNVVVCHTESQPATKSDAVEASIAPSSTASECVEAPLLASSTIAVPETAGPNAEGESTGLTASEEAPQEQEPPACLSRAEAARRNGAKSRGPRTEQGKERSRRNAVKHGLVARTLLIALAMEDREAFESVLDGLRESYQPRSYEEQQLVELAAAELWRLAQAARLELGNFAHDEIFSCAVPDRLSRYHTAAWRRYTQILERLEKIKALRQSAADTEHFAGSDESPTEEENE